MVSRSQVIAMQCYVAQSVQLMQYVIVNVHQLAEQRIIGVLDQFSHRQLIDRTEAGAHSSVERCWTLLYTVG